MSNIIPSRIVSASPSLTHYSAELLLGVGLMHTLSDIHAFTRHV